MPKEEIKDRRKKILELCRSFCEEKLNDEYLQLCEKLINKMGRKRDIPFKRGKLDIWAAAIVHAIGTVNFLFDKSFEPFFTVSDINDYFSTKNSTVFQKTRSIQDMFNMSYFDADFSTKQMSDQSPFNNMEIVDGNMKSLLREDALY